MAKFMKLTDEVHANYMQELDAYLDEKQREFFAEAEKIREDFEKLIISGKTANGKFSVNKTISLNFSKAGDEVEQKAHLTFSPTAWIKTHAVVSVCDKEAAWNATAVRDPDTPNGYIIKDVFVYPHEVTSVTVDRDAGAYSKWLDSFPDEIFNEIRCQGHSHVNMGVSPSADDLTHQQEVIDQLSGDMFYIFLIVNKRMDIYAKIVDLQSNLIFEPEDVEYSIQGMGIGSFLNELETNVKPKVYKDLGKNSKKSKKQPAKNKNEYDYVDELDEEELDEFADRYNGLYPRLGSYSYGGYGGYYGRDY